MQRLHLLTKDYTERHVSTLPLAPGPITNCGESRGGPSISVGGERKARVSDDGRPRGEGPYGDLSPVRELISITIAHTLYITTN